jgi:putative ABC transport system substrate-binding protein
MLDWRFGASVSHSCEKLYRRYPGWAFSPHAQIGNILKEKERRFGDHVDAVVVSDDAENFTNRRVIVELVEKVALPAIYSWPEHVELGGLMAYAFDLPDLFRRAAQQVGQILQGANSADTPFYQSSKFDLVINLKTAKALGLTFPPSLLARADKVIE